MNRYQHIIWDWNGTLLNDVDLCVDVMNRMLLKRGMSGIDTIRYRDIFDFPVESYYRELGFDFAVDSFEGLAHEYCDEYDQRVLECSLQAGTLDILRTLSDTKIQQSILSACEQNSLLRVIEHHGLTPHFSDVVGQMNSYATGKILAGRTLVERSAISSSNTLLIGDTLHDLEVAKSLGATCVLIANGHHSRHRLSAGHEDVVDSLEGVLEYAV
ncbi:MAG: HAD family hydrolase [Planctomicrobium sp.]|nr:HAD family hydrolase [Planctomicrobium sp.]